MAEDDEKAKYTIICGNLILRNLSDEFVDEHDFVLDGNIYLQAGSELIEVNKNSDKFITNDTFESPIFCGKNPCDLIQEFLVYHGKIPSYVKVGESAGKGYGIFATKKIKQGTFLGYYDGIRKPNVHDEANIYKFTCFNDEKLTIDAENMIFSNWVRFVNDGENQNCECRSGNYSIMLYSLKDILPGEELLYSYGEEYWTNRTKV